MGHRAVGHCRKLRHTCAAGIVMLLVRPLGAQQAPSATFPVEPAPAGSQAPPAPTGAPPPVVYASPEAYAEPTMPAQALLAQRGPPAGYPATGTPSPAPPAEPRSTGEHPSPDVGWSLGAGIGFGETPLSTSPLATIGSTSDTATPSYRLSLERRLGRNTWLALNGSLSYTHSEQPVLSSSTTTPRTRETLDLESAQEALLLGLRQVVSRGVVDVSLYLAVGGTHSKTRGDMPAQGELVSVVPGGRGNALSALGGVAVERELIDALALRLSADVVGVTLFKRTDIRIDSTTQQQSTTERSGQAATLMLRPTIQLQFYF